MSLGPDDIVRARALRNQTPPAHWRHIANELKQSVYMVRCALDPDFAKWHRDRVRAMAAGHRAPTLPEHLRTRRGTKTVDATNHTAEGKVAVPPDVLADQLRVLDYVPSTPTAALCGDPPPWRSALARRENA